MADRNISIRTVVDLTSLSRATIYRQLKHTTHPFPAPARFGHRMVWKESEVLAWVEARFAERDMQPQVGEQEARA